MSNIPQNSSQKVGIIVTSNQNVAQEKEGALTGRRISKEDEAISRGKRIDLTALPLSFATEEEKMTFTEVFSKFNTLRKEFYESGDVKNRAKCLNKCADLISEFTEKLFSEKVNTTTFQVNFLMDSVLEMQKFCEIESSQEKLDQTRISTLKECNKRITELNTELGRQREILQKMLVNREMLTRKQDELIEEIKNISNLVKDPDSTNEDLKKKINYLFSEYSKIKLEKLKLGDELDRLSIQAKEISSNSDDLLSERNKLRALIASTIRMGVCFANLDSCSVPISAMSSTSASSYHSLIQDLKNFIEKNGQNPAIGEWKKVLSEIEFAYHINNSLKTTPIEEVSIEILKQLSSLKEPPECVFFQGGYYSNKELKDVGHKVVYRFEKEKDGKFSLTIINTGEGASTTKAGSKEKTEDIIYTGLTLDQLKVALPKILEPLLPNSSYDMEEVIKIIEADLLIKDATGIPNKYSGDKHRLQQKGTCAMRCLLSWLYTRVGKEQYRKFRPDSLQTSLNLAKEEVRKWKQDHTWKLLTFGTENSNFTDVVINKMFTQMEAKIANAKKKVS